MKKSFKQILLGAVSGLALCGAVFAGDGSFNTTNNLVNGTQYISYPTNATGTSTGGGIDISVGYKTVGIYLSGDLQNSSSAPIGITLVRANKLTTSGTTNWETTAVYNLLITAPARTNHFDWSTNLPEDFTGAAVKVGISQLTNNFTSGNTISNLDIGVIKKYTTIRYP
jgi:hypothetical protein